MRLKKILLKPISEGEFDQRYRFWYKMMWNGQLPRFKKSYMAAIERPLIYQNYKDLLEMFLRHQFADKVSFYADGHWNTKPIEKIRKDKEQGDRGTVIYGLWVPQHALKNTTF